MFSRSAGDKLAMGAITALSLVMTGSSQLLWRRLQEHSIDGSPLDAWSLERLTGVALGLFGAAVIAWLLLSVALAVLAHLL
ncbi:MAG: hypothetical protein Q4P23_00700, partial [Micrococcaceae bacterium]|nr:hypothetical protein [Micrococcaceae bacterium]